MRASEIFRACRTLVEVVNMSSVILLFTICNVISLRDPIPDRVETLLSKMTLEEKVMQLTATHNGEDIVDKFINTSVGTVKYESAIHCNTAVDCITARNELQRKFIEGSRLNIPLTFVNEGLHGGAPNATIFPMPINQGASWNVSLVSNIADAIADQASTMGVQVVFAPVVNMMTDPRFGRGQEGYGEEPTLTSHMGEAAVRGLQGPDGCNGTDTYFDSSRYVASLAKHMAAYGAASGGLNGAPADITNRSLHDHYLKPWRSLARANVRATMASHNTVNDIPAHGNRWLLHDSYRRSMGFNGVIMSDCNDLGVLVDFGIATNKSHAAAIGVHATVDLDLQCSGKSNSWTFNHLQNAVLKGLVKETEVDDAVRRVLTLKYASGSFDSPYTTVNMTRINSLDGPKNRMLARDAARQSVTLLQNDGLLPLNDVFITSTAVTIAFIGPAAKGDEGTAMIGGYALEPYSHIVSTQEGLINAGFKGKILSATGSTAVGNPDDADPSLIPEAVQIAKQADLVILVLGDLSGGCGEWEDRDNLDLQGNQVNLMKAITSIHKKVITVLINGRPQTFGRGNDVLKNTSALLNTMRPGSEGGNAIWDVLLGKYNPSSKLTQSWPRTVGQVQGGASPFMQRIRGKWVSNSRGPTKSGRNFDPYVNDGWLSTPLFDFGFGLSYTTYEYVSMTLGNDSVTVTIRNAGPLPGSEIVQIYVRDPVGYLFVHYWQRLLAFTKVFIDSGETKSVVIPYSTDDLSMHDGNMRLRVLSGVYTILVGSSSSDIQLNTTLFV